MSDPFKMRLALGYAAGLVTYAVHDFVSYPLPVTWLALTLAWSGFLGAAVYSVGVLLERSFGSKGMKNCS